MFAAKGTGEQPFQLVVGEGIPGEAHQYTRRDAPAPVRLAEPVAHLGRTAFHVLAEHHADGADRWSSTVTANAVSGVAPLANAMNSRASSIEYGWGKRSRNCSHTLWLSACRASSAASVSRNDRTPHDSRSSCITRAAGTSDASPGSTRRSRRCARRSYRGTGRSASVKQAERFHQVVEAGRVQQNTPRAPIRPS